jgi:hypothetical protein
MSRPYVGALEDDDGSLRLSGRDPETGIEVGLRIPYQEIACVRLSGEPDSASGEPCVVLELAGSPAICLHEVGGTRPRLVGLANSLEARVIPGQAARAYGFGRSAGRRQRR